MDSNFAIDLLIDKSYRYAILEDMHVVFRLDMAFNVESTRDFKSGREMADWLAASMEEKGQLIY
jgi:hypothetical protein